MLFGNNILMKQMDEALGRPSYAFFFWVSSEFQTVSVLSTAGGTPSVITGIIQASECSHPETCHVRI